MDTDPTTWIALTRDLGFPIVVSAYVLIRLDRRLVEVQQALTSLTIIIATQCGIDIEKIEALTGQHNHKRKDDRKTA